MRVYILIYIYICVCVYMYLIHGLGFYRVLRFEVHFEPLSAARLHAQTETIRAAHVPVEERRAFGATKPTTFLHQRPFPRQYVVSRRRRPTRRVSPHDHVVQHCPFRVGSRQRQRSRRRILIRPRRRRRRRRHEILRGRFRNVGVSFRVHLFARHAIRVAHGPVLLPPKDRPRGNHHLGRPSEQILREGRRLRDVHRPQRKSTGEVGRGRRLLRRRPRRRRRRRLGLGDARADGKTRGLEHLRRPRDVADGGDDVPSTRESLPNHQAPQTPRGAKDDQRVLGHEGRGGLRSFTPTTRGDLTRSTTATVSTPHCGRDTQPEDEQDGSGAEE